MPRRNWDKSRRRFGGKGLLATNVSDHFTWLNPLISSSTSSSPCRNIVFARGMRVLLMTRSCLVPMISVGTNKGPNGLLSKKFADVGLQRSGWVARGGQDAEGARRIAAGWCAGHRRFKCRAGGGRAGSTSGWFNFRLARDPGTNPEKTRDALVRRWATRQVQSQRRSRQSQHWRLHVPSACVDAAAYLRSSALGISVRRNAQRQFSEGRSI